MRLPSGSKRIYAALVALLEEHGVTKHTLTHVGKHPKIQFEYKGRPHTYAFGNSPRSDNAPKFARRELARVFR